MIKKVQSTDFDYIYGLYMHPEINPFLLYEQKSKAEFRPIFEELLAQNVLYLFIEDEKTVGMFKLMPLLHRNAHIAYLGGVAIDAACKGRGFGYKMLQAVIDFGATLGYRRIELSTATVNEAAIRLYEKVGFEREGVLRRYTYLASEDKYLDEVFMSYLY